jgi:hypothetical protein
MALTITATPGAANANSYATLVEANAYHEAHLYASAWNAADTTKRTAALVWAARLLDQEVLWGGYATTEYQAMMWPRTNLYDRDGYAIDSDVIPKEVKDAQAELARKLIESDRTAESGTEGFSAISVSVISLTIDAFDRIKVLPDSVMNIISHLGSRKNSGKGMKVIDLVRV